MKKILFLNGIENKKTIKKNVNGLLNSQIFCKFHKIEIFSKTKSRPNFFVYFSPAVLVNQHQHQQQQQQQQQQHSGRKKNLAVVNSNSNNTATEIKSNQNQVQQHQHQQQQLACEDGEQPAKFLKVFNTSTKTTTSTTTNGHHQQQQQQHSSLLQHEIKTHGQKLLLTSSAGIIQNGGCGGNITNIGGSIAATAAVISKTLNNGSVSYVTAATTATTTNTPARITSTSELCRLPGGAELNILPTNGLKITSGGGAGSVATAFYHANGKIAFVNGLPAASHHSHQYQYQHPPSSSPLPNSTNIASNGTTTITNGFLLKDTASGVTPLLVSATSSPTMSNVNGLHFAGNFAQLLAAANTSATATNTGHSLNGTANATIVPMAANFQNVTESRAKTNNKASIVTWRSGAATTN